MPGAFSLSCRKLRFPSSFPRKSDTGTGEDGQRDPNEHERDQMGHGEGFTIDHDTEDQGDRRRDILQEPDHIKRDLLRAL